MLANPAYVTLSAPGGCYCTSLKSHAEYLAQLRTDVEGFVALEIVEACTGDYREMLPAAQLLPSFQGSERWLR